MINLTQHPATPEQLAAGVVDCSGEQLARLKELLTFESLPTHAELAERADQISMLAGDYDQAMIGGAPFFMTPLECALIDRGIAPCYAFSVRSSTETIVDGIVKKSSCFSHAGFIFTAGSN